MSTETVATTKKRLSFSEFLRLYGKFVLVYLALMALFFVSVDVRISFLGTALLAVTLFVSVFGLLIMGIWKYLFSDSYQKLSSQYNLRFVYEVVFACFAFWLSLFWFLFMAVIFHTL